ncbi:hypothetical protein KSF_033870 [Reticulibacter mediterranei]|uniref:Uncharacterized protein n=1 Tax=Reticulibacter mediterranei TaxID=2778369 RepID=A0A8J3MZP7_9CHLR|nr:hypothetical protein [Reticulibacter mediterranei]GHO93339.1 hypothetical protein KSF_033870 [Reticulibacter mediterranei]
MVNPERIARIERSVAFLDGTTEENAVAAEVVFADPSKNLVIVNVVGRLRCIRVGGKVHNLSPCNNQVRIAQPDDESTWPVEQEGVIFLVRFPVTDEIAERRPDFREAPYYCGILNIEF